MEDKQIMLSVVVCTHNRAKLLKEALGSIFRQRVDFTMEVIVSDDCSTDNTVSMLKELKENHSMLRINVTPENYGPGGNWASAMKLVQGKYVAFLDDDDLWPDENRMQTLVDCLEANPDIDVVYTDGFTFNKRGKKEPYLWPKEDFPNLQKMWRGEQPCISLDMMVVRTSMINKSVQYDDYIRLKLPTQDWNTNLLLLSHNARFSFINHPSVAVRQNLGSLSRTADYDKIIQKARLEAVMNSYIDQQITGDHTLSYDIDEQRLYRSLLNAAYQNGDWHRAKEYSKKSGEHTIRVKCCRFWITFSLFRLAKQCRILG